MNTHETTKGSEVACASACYASRFKDMICGICRGSGEIDGEACWGCNPCDGDLRTDDDINKADEDHTIMCDPDNQKYLA